MKSTIEWFKPKDKMPEKYNKSDSSNDLLISEKDGTTKIGHYNFKNKCWNDSTTYHDYYDYDKIKNVKYWAYLPKI